MPFKSKEYDDYAKYMGFKRVPITPVYPQANGMIERFNAGLKKISMTTKIEHKKWQRELCTYLRNYRCTPHRTTEQAPASLFFNKINFCTRIPEIRVNETDDAILREKVRKNKVRLKKYADRKSYVKKCHIAFGDTVLVKKRRRRKSDPYYDPVPYAVTNRS